MVPAVTSGPRQSSRLAVAAHVVSLVGGFLVLLHANRDQWFFGDEWDFLGHRGVVAAERSIWEPHTDHWSTGPILIYRGLFALYGVQTYVPYIVVLLVLHVAVAHLLWQLLRQERVDPVVATALAAVYAVLGAGYENLLWAFQIGFIGSVALGLTALLLVNHGGRWGARDVSAWFVSVAGLMFSGVTVTMVTVAGLTVLMRRGWRQAALTVSVPGAVYLTWFLVIDQNPPAKPRAIDDVFKYPEYIWTGLRSAIDQTVGFPGAGAILVLGLIAYLLRRAGQASGPAAPAFACAIGALMLYAIIATGRAGLGIEQSEASRYTYIVMALALPAMGLALSELAGPSGPGSGRQGPSGPGSGRQGPSGPPALAGALGGRPGPPGHPTGPPAAGGRATGGRRAVICLILLLVAVHNVGVLREKSKSERRLEQRLKAQILAAGQLLSSPAVILGGNPEPVYSPDIELDDLRRMQRDGKLPAPTHITPDDRLAVATVLQYAVSPSPLPTRYTAPLVDGVVGATDSSDGPGCIRLVPTGPVAELHLVGGEAMSLRVTTLVSGDLTGYLRIFTPAVRTGAPHVDKVRAGVPVYVNVTAFVDQVVLRVPPSGSTQVCGVL